MKKLAIISLILFLLTGITWNLYSSTGKSELKKEIVKIKYVKTQAAYSILREFLSPKGKIRIVESENRLIIEDIPEVVEKLLSILKEIDVKLVDLQLNVELILGSMTSGEKMDLDKDIKSDPVIKELRTILKYESFKRLDSTIIKIQDNKFSSQRIGGEGISLRLIIRPRYIKEEKGDTIQVKLELYQHRGFRSDGREKTLILIDTTLTLKSRERTVVGVSKLDGGDKALILIISGEVIG